jgi:ABC-type transport system involved in cytochrome c biogenesis permease subunit
MATNVANSKNSAATSNSGPSSNGSSNAGGKRSLWTDLLMPLASLKVTVVLFACSMFIIMVGTLAQVDKDMWEVIRDYFRAWIAWIDFQVFAPRSWFPGMQGIRGGFWFPGGATIGLALAVNLIAAHLVVFKIQARGVRLWLGLLGLALGVTYTYIVITGGHNPHGLQGEPPLAWTTIWLLVKIGTAAIGVGCAAYAMLLGSDRWVERRLLWTLAVIFGLSSAFLFAAGTKAYLGDSGMRILWQLIQASVAAVLLLIACVMLFGSRGGRVLLHGGVALVMFGQFFVAQYDIEEQISIQEGQTVSYARDIRQTELSIVDQSGPDVDKISAIPQSFLLASKDGRTQSWWSRLTRGPIPLDEKGFIVDESLPFRIKVLKYYKNGQLSKLKPGDKNLATAGNGLKFVAVPVRASSGASMGDQADMAAAYVQLTKKDGSGDLGTYLLSQILSFQEVSEQVKVDGKSYDLSLRFRQNYKPYSLTLIDVRKDDYMGTDMARNYSSDVRLVDKERGVDRQVRIWMNNPLRYAGETFYQSGFHGSPNSPIEGTTLQVVTNSGWMIPYVACMIVAFGMGAQFVEVLVRFLSARTTRTTGRWTFRSPASNGAAEAGALPDKAKGATRDEGARGSRKSKRAQAADSALAPAGALSRYGAWGLGLFLLVLAAWLAKTFVPPRAAADGMNVYAFGQLPLVSEGRVKPFDTLARNSMRVIANRETFKDQAGKSQPATRWLLDVIANPARAEKHRVFRIVNREVAETLGLKPRQGNLYSVAELSKGMEAFEKQLASTRTKDKNALSVYERELRKLSEQIQVYSRLASAFRPVNLPPLPAPGDDEKTSQQRIQDFQQAYSTFVRNLEMDQPPLAVPLKTNIEGKPDQKWQSYSRAWTDALIGVRLMGQAPDPSVTHLESIFVAYTKKDAKEFNKQVAAYQRYLQEDPPAELKVSPGLVTAIFGNFYRFEAYFNQVSPFFNCAWLYLVAFILAAFAWLGWSGPLNRAAFLVMAGTLVVHTFALAARIYISGRPPVTNLYSSAVFIGWGIVVLSMVFEWLYRNGIGNAVAAALGFGSLLIAHFLALDGDTFTVLQAVLDTQFWLATHVVSITFGYSTTFLAGGLGILYVLRGVLTRSLDEDTSQELSRMIYGTICFSMFFSFFGTVLGGLWADDSWGRFWGWDPKENGALIIVLWNALVLHARWSGMVQRRGLAVLSVGGNIVTAWSWFGVNQLGVGLHAYGFTEGVLLALGVFVGSQLAVIVMGCLPMAMWRSGGSKQLATQ